MNSDWESVFSKWSQGPSISEQNRAENAENMIKSAIQNSLKLQSKNCKIFLQGSYRNRVNVRKDSDVDVGIVCFDSFFPDYSDDNVKALASKTFSDSSYSYSELKNDVENALIAKFGHANVTRGNKAFDIHENSYHVEADVAVFFEHRRYISESKYYSGVEMIPDNLTPNRIRNWPEQHYENGVAKNSRTSRRYKRLIRILKSLSNFMCSQGIFSGQDIPGFLIECLVWNIPDEKFNYSSYEQIVRSGLAWLFNNTLDDEQCNEWGEVSELKYLFRSSQPWTRKDAHLFISNAWDYLGYK